MFIVYVVFPTALESTHYVCFVLLRHSYNYSVWYLTRQNCPQVARIGSTIPGGSLVDCKTKKNPQPRCWVIFFLCLICVIVHQTPTVWAWKQGQKCVSSHLAGVWSRWRTCFSCWWTGGWSGVMGLVAPSPAPPQLPYGAAALPCWLVPSLPWWNQEQITNN